jgi:hypothetical protein
MMVAHVGDQRPAAGFRHARDFANGRGAAVG